MASRLEQWVTAHPATVPAEETPASGATIEQSLSDRTFRVLMGEDHQAAPPQVELPDDERFVDEGVLGYGGSAVVRRVMDRTLLRRVALKAFTSSSAAAKERFLAEAQITAQLEHPNIVPVHEYGTDANGRAFMSMKLVSGDTLAQKLEDLGLRRLDPEPLSELLAVLRHVCDALGYAHSQGVTHRDLKPSNIMVGSFGKVYVMDWGIAVLGPRSEVQTSASLVVDVGVSGTPAYMAPEQVSGEATECDARTDVYALGGVLYSILTGRPPHVGRSTREVLFRAMEGKVTPPQEVVSERPLPPTLCNVAMKALSPDPAGRYSSVEGFRGALDAFQGDLWKLPTRTFTTGECVLCEGDEGHEAFRVLQGRCLVRSHGEGALLELGPGEVFGEMAVITGRPRDATVEALSDVVVQVLSRDELQAVLGLGTWSGEFVKALARRISGTNVSSGPVSTSDD